MHESALDVCNASLSEKRNDWEEPDKGANDYLAAEHGDDRSAMGERPLLLS